MHAQGWGDTGPRWGGGSSGGRAKQCAEHRWVGGVCVSSEKRQKGREGRPPEGAAGLLRQTGGSQPDWQLYWPVCPQSGTRGWKTPPLPRPLPEGLRSRRGIQTGEAGEVSEDLIRKVLCKGASSVNPRFNLLKKHSVENVKIHKGRRSGRITPPRCSTPALILSALEHSGFTHFW